VDGDETGTYRERGLIMSIVNATQAQEQFLRLMDFAINAHEAVYVTGKLGNIVMVSEEDYRSMQETAYLGSIPEVRDKIIRGLATPLSECVEDADEE
jgi:PHD/YefM family antitoxin component YafN of YafNO toxin-antitoxin module